MVRHYFLVWLLILIGVSDGSSLARRRLRRQILPSQHIQVHSIDSKVLLDKLITVDSTDSRVELSEKNLNGTIWSQKSKVQFDTYDTFVNATAEIAQSIMNILNCVFIHGTSLESQLFMRTNRTSDGHTYLNHQLYDNANVSITDEGVRVQGIGARRVGVEAQTWEKYLEKTMTLSALNNPASGDRELMLTINAPLYHIDVCFVGAMIYIEFGDKLVQIDPDFRTVNIYTNRYTINFKTKDMATPYDVKLSNEEITIRCPQEQTTVFVQPGGVNVHVEEFSKMQLDRGGGEMLIGGQPLNADSVRVISLAALLSLANNGNVRADTTKSEILVQTPVQNVGLTAAHHDIQVLGGVPHLVVEAGLAIVEVTAANGLPSSITLLPPFSPPEDRYLTIGPYQAPNVTSSPMVFPEPDQFNVTQSPLDGCGGGFGGVHPRNQTIYPGNPQGSTTMPTTVVTHEIVTYHTPAPTEITTSAPLDLTTLAEIITTPAVVTEDTKIFSTDSSMSGFPTLIPTTDETYPFPTDFDIDNTSPEPTEIQGSVGPNEVTPPGSETSTETNAELTTQAVIDVTTAEESTEPTPTQTSPSEETTASNSGETTPGIPEPSAFPVDQLETTSVFVLPTDSVYETSPGIPEPSELPVNQETTPGIPEPSELPIDGQASTQSMPEPSDLPLNQETTPGMPEPSELPITATTIDTIPFPSEFPTDDFVIGHWFSTEDSSERTTTETSEFSITATIGSIDLATLSTSSAPSSTDSIPTPPASLGNGKLLVLKMRVPDGIDVNSPDFARNITMSLKRLVRDTKTKMERRFRRNTEDLIEPSENVTDDPLKVKQIMKFDNVTVVTFSFENFEITQEELEKALYDLETKDLNEYFDFPTMEHISVIESNYKNISLEKESELPWFLMLIIGMIICILISGSYYFINHGETSIIIKRMGRHFTRYTAPEHSPPQEAFERA